MKSITVIFNVGTSLMETKKCDTIDVNNCIKFLVIVVKSMLGLLEGHLAMRSKGSLMSERIVQLQKQGRNM
jgi:hypothetical protein